MKAVVIALVALVVIAGGAFALTKKSDTPTPSTTTQTTTTNNSTDPTTPSTSTDINSATTITYSNSGFSPAKLTVKAGDTVTVVNNSSGSLQFDSDPHPDHTDNTELNIGIIAKGKSATMTLTKKGTWGYHNHLSSTDTGTITVN